MLLLFRLNQGKTMTTELQDFKVLTNQELNLILSDELAAKIPQYQDVILEEILDLLEEAVETYIFLKPTLPTNIQSNALKEIEFFITLYQEKLDNSRHIQTPQPEKKFVQLLSGCGCYDN